MWNENLQLSFLKKRSFWDYLFTELFAGTIVINWIEMYLSLANFHTKQAVFFDKESTDEKKSLRLPLGLWLCLRKYGLYQYLSLDFTIEGMLKIFKFPRYKHLSRTFWPKRVTEAAYQKVTLKKEFFKRNSLSLFF